MSDKAIVVENLSKRYLIGHRSASGGYKKYTTLRDVIARKFGNFARRASDFVRGRQVVQGDEVEEFWALRDVSFQVKQGEVLEDQIYYIDYVTTKAIWELQRINLNPLHGTYTGDTVILDFCLPLAHLMGFQEVILVGCDCTLGKIAEENSSSRHFYNERDQNTCQQTDDYLQNHWRQNVFNSYRVAKDAFEASGRKIYNATLGGDLELFERVPLGSLIRKT